MAKIYYSLYDRMLNEKGLLQAFAKVKSNKGSPGVDGQAIADFAEHLTGEIAVLADTHLLRNFEGRIDRSRIRGRTYGSVRGMRWARFVAHLTLLDFVRGSKNFAFRPNLRPPQQCRNINKRPSSLTSTCECV